MSQELPTPPKLNRRMRRQLYRMQQRGQRSGATKVMNHFNTTFHQRTQQLYFQARQQTPVWVKKNGRISDIKCPPHMRRFAGLPYLLVKQYKD